MLLRMILKLEGRMVDSPDGRPYTVSATAVSTISASSYHSPTTNKPSLSRRHRDATPAYSHSMPTPPAPWFCAPVAQFLSSGLLPRAASHPTHAQGSQGVYLPAVLGYSASVSNPRCWRSCCAFVLRTITWTGPAFALRPPLC
ncbi:hypothetical protein C8Q79DRAFT_739360 [Trametes meyenii]|nr:hypothetical protein C8Q79DRAFT_739360 [Trametes meyenii]